MNSFTSVSIEPPLVAIFVMENSRTLKSILQTGKYVINILKHDQETEARQFANDGMDDKFSGISHSMNGNGLPILAKSLGYIECEIHSTQKIEDHVMVLGRVMNASVENDLDALIYYRRGFRSFN